jgi:hypothetical protein
MVLMTSFRSATATLPIQNARQAFQDHALEISRLTVHIDTMKKSPRVTFSCKRIAEGDWQIEAHCPGTEVRYIKGLVSKADVDEWLAGERKITWLRSQGYAK